MFKGLWTKTWQSVLYYVLKPSVEAFFNKTSEGDEQMGKGLLRSKTFWVNSITAMVSIGTYLMDSALLANNPEIIALGGTAIGVMNVILRLLTKEPIQGVK
jgi:hypothetical protein